MKRFWPNYIKIKRNFTEELLHVCMLLKYKIILSMQRLKYRFKTKLPKIKDVKITVNKQFLWQFFSFPKEFWYNLEISIVYEKSVCFLLQLLLIWIVHFPKSLMFRYDHEDRSPSPGKKVRNTEALIRFLKM